MQTHFFFVSLTVKDRLAAKSSGRLGKELFPDQVLYALGLPPQKTGTQERPRTIHK